MIAGVGSFAFGWAVADGTPPMEETGLVDFACGHGVSVVQLGDNLPVHTFSEQRLDALVVRARQAGITLELGARGLTEAHLERYLQLCQRCGATLLRFVADAPEYTPPPDDIHSLLCNATSAIEAAGVTLAFENHDRFSARTLRTLIDRVGTAHVGICLDTANSLGAGEGLEYVTDLLAPVTVNLHVKDVAIARLSHQQGFLVAGRPLGTGQLPIRETLARVAAFGRCQSVVLENWIAPAAQPDQTVRDERAAVDAGIEMLKTWL